MNDLNNVILSFSSYSVYKRCPYRYYLEKVKRIKVPFDTSLTVPGLILHKAAEKFIRENDSSLFSHENILKAIEEFEQDPMINIENAFKSKDKLIADLFQGARFLQSFILSEKNTSKKIYSEYQIGHYKHETLKISEHCSLQGSTDLIAIKENNIANIYDYKFTFTKKHLDGDQLILYTIAVEKLLNLKINLAGFFMIPLNRTHFVLIPEENKQRLIDNLEKTAVNILNEQFYKFPEENKCSMCPYKDICNNGLNEKPKDIPLLGINNLSF